MKITDMISITELSKSIGKSRPTVYKYISDYEHGSYDQVPASLLKLFDRIEKENITKSEVYQYCEKYFYKEGDTPSTYDDVIKLIRENRDKLDLASLKKQLKKEIEEYGK